jgi:hypothetical protein
MGALVPAAAGSVLCTRGASAYVLFCIANWLVVTTTVDVLAILSVSRTDPIRFASTGNGSSRADPAQSSRKPPQVPANPRTPTDGEPCCRRKSPPIPA